MKLGHRLILSQKKILNGPPFHICFGHCGIQIICGIVSFEFSALVVGVCISMRARLSVYVCVFGLSFLIGFFVRRFIFSFFSGSVARLPVTKGTSIKKRKKWPFVKESPRNSLLL